MHRNKRRVEGQEDSGFMTKRDEREEEAKPTENRKILGDKVRARVKERNRAREAQREQLS